MPNTYYPTDPILGVRSSAATPDTSSSGAGLKQQFALGTVVALTNNRKAIYLLAGNTISAASTVSFAAAFTAQGGGGGDLRALSHGKSGGAIQPGEYFWAYTSVLFALT